MKAEIIVLAGQSNAVGVGHVRYLPRHFSAERLERFEKGYENILINYYSHDIKSNGFVKTAYGCTEKSKNTFGPEVGMADALNLRYPQKTVFIVKCAFGGTDIVNNWASPSRGEIYDPLSFAEGDTQDEHYRNPGWCYNELIKTVKESLSILESQGYDPQIKAFCWMQGESDALDEKNAVPYIDRYEMLLNDFDTNFGEYMSGCVYVDAGISECWQHYEEINRQKQQHAEKTENSFYIDTIGCGLATTNEPEREVDWAHYDSDSTIRLGELFAENIKL